LSKPIAPRTRILAVLDRKGEVKRSFLISPDKYSQAGAFYNELIRVRKELLNEFPPPKFRLVEGTASNLSELMWSYPELREAVS